MFQAVEAIEFTLCIIFTFRACPWYVINFIIPISSYTTCGAQRFFASHKAIIEQRIEPLEQIGGHSIQTSLAIYTYAC